MSMIQTKGAVTACIALCGVMVVMVTYITSVMIAVHGTK